MTKGAKVFNFAVSLICATMFVVPLVGIAFHWQAQHEAERRWKETERIEFIKTEKIVIEFNNFVSAKNLEKQLEDLKKQKVLIEKQGIELHNKQVSANSK